MTRTTFTAIEAKSALVNQRHANIVILAPGIKWWRYPMRNPSATEPIIRTSSATYTSRTAARSQAMRHLAVTRQTERYQNRWERNSKVRSVNAMALPTGNQPQFTEILLQSNT